MVELNLKIPAIEKLVDYCASGIGAIGGPMLSRWTAQRRADAQRIEAQGQADVTRLIADAQAEARSLLPADHSSSRGELAIGKEIKSRLEFQEKKRQGNIKAVIGMAAEELGDKDATDHEVDHDWTARFFADAQDATSEHMQKIWAKILAGEVETPGRTSLHTLAILKNMTQRDAKLFENVSRFIFYDFVLKDKKYSIKISGFPSFNDITVLQSYGLMASAPMAKHFKIPVNHLIVKNNIYKISKSIDSEPYEFDIPCYALTPQGSELYNINNAAVSEDYLHLFSKFLNDEHGIKLESSLILGHLEDKLLYGPWTLVEPQFPQTTQTVGENGEE